MIPDEKSIAEQSGHLPQGRCGLKYALTKYNAETGLSPSARKVWIEIQYATFQSKGATPSPSARKVWIEILSHIPLLPSLWSPSARKVWIEMLSWKDKAREFKSPSARKVWIEMFFIGLSPFCGMSPSARKVWIEMLSSSIFALPFGSPSARKVWIEIAVYKYEHKRLKCHLPQGRCGLKYHCQCWNRLQSGHLPQGRCGLKLNTT